MMDADAMGSDSGLPKISAAYALSWPVWPVYARCPDMVVTAPKVDPMPTAAMITAGAEALVAHRLMHGDDYDTVYEDSAAAVYRAMQAARPQ